MKLKLLDKHGISLEDRPLAVIIYGAFEWAREYSEDPRTWWIDLETFTYVAGNFEDDAPLDNWIRREDDRFRLTQAAIDLFREHIGFVPPRIGPEYIANMSVNRGTVSVSVQYRLQPTVSPDGVIAPGRDVNVYHEVDIADEPSSAVSLRAIQEALALANDALAAWDALAA